MAKICLAWILFITSLNAFSQQDGLVLIDADDHLPFFLRMGDRTYRSSPVGHLSISNLKDSTYIITIGFSKDRYPESQFSVRVTRKDQGFHLKQTKGKGPELYNWQTQESILPLQSKVGAGNRSLATGVRMDDAFSRLMAAVVNDTLVMYNTYVVDQVADTSKSILVPSNGSGLQKSDAFSDSSRKQSAVNKPVAGGPKSIGRKPSKVTKTLPAVMLAQQSIADMYQLTYISYSKKGHADTVHIEIPLETAKNSTGAEPSSITGEALANKQELLKDSGVIIPAQPEVKKKTANTNCRKIATDHDIDALRVRMMNEYMEDHRIEVAEKFFSSKCVSVNQVKALAELFSGDKSRFQFYEAAYPFVSDPENFGELSASLLEKSYKDQFNAQF